MQEYNARGTVQCESTAHDEIAVYPAATSIKGQSEIVSMLRPRVWQFLKIKTRIFGHSLKLGIAPMPVPDRSSTFNFGSCKVIWRNDK